MSNSEELNTMFGSDDEDDQQPSSTSTSYTSTIPSSSTLPVNRPQNNGVLAFHNGTEEALLLYVSQHATRGNPTSVLQAVDRYCYERHWMMHMGEEKSRIVVEVLTNTLATHRTSSTTASFVVVELGSYCGYSAVTMAQYLSPSQHEHLYCIEVNINCVQWTRRLIDFAGLSDRVTVIHAGAQQCNQWKAQLTRPSIDLLFIDHDKKAYYDDLKIIEQEGLLVSGSIVIADNVLCFHAPLTNYLNHVRDTTRYVSSKLYEGFLEYTTEEDRKNSAYVDGMEVSIRR